MFKYLQQRTHLVRLISYLLIATGAITIVSWQWLQDYCLNWVKAVLDCKPIYVAIIILSLLMGLYYSYFYVRLGKSKEISLFKMFGPLFDPPANSLGYGIALTSTLTLFKGIFKQVFFKEQYFVDLGYIDVATIMLACIPLVIWSVTGLVTFFIAVFIKKDSESGVVEIKSEPNREN
jgi:hypothetical protein